jgi:hypothetical protein
MAAANFTSRGRRFSIRQNQGFSVNTEPYVDLSVQQDANTQFHQQFYSPGQYNGYSQHNSTSPHHNLGANNYSHSHAVYSPNTMAMASPVSTASTFTNYGPLVSSAPASFESNMGFCGTTLATHGFGEEPPNE